MEDPMLSTLSIVLAVVVGGALLVWAQRSYTLHSCGASIRDAMVPKGSFGWPLIGESLAFFRDPKAFAHSRVKKHGSIFTTSLFSRLTIVGTTPDFAKLVASNSKLFRPAFPKHITEILGSKSFLLQDSPLHLPVKSLVVKALRAEVLRTQVHAIETIILEKLASWERTETPIELNEAAKKLTWETSNWVLFRDSQSSSTPVGKKNFNHMKQILQATVSLPLNVPGTPYAKGLKARVALTEHNKNHIKRGKGQKTNEGVFLETLVAARDDPEGREALKQLDDDTISDTIFLLNFAAYDTTSTTLLWITKLLVDYPDVFRRIQAEQQEILKTKDPSLKGPRLTWEDTRNMVYTNKFFLEVQRHVSIVPMVVREATEDVKYEGHLIPKGWMVWTMFKFIHSDPANYPDLSFNPDRFNSNPKPFTFLPFHAGAHLCPGIELAKLISFIFIHHITTTYIYEPAGPDRGVHLEGIFPKPIGGYPIKVHLRS